jgi:hypothetical protein
VAKKSPSDEVITALNTVDVGTLLGGVLNDLKTSRDGASGEAFGAQLGTWSSAFGSDLHDLAERIRRLRRIRGYKAAQRAFASANAYRASGLHVLHGAVLRQSQRDISRWRWVMTAYARAIRGFVADRERAEAADHLARRLLPALEVEHIERYWLLDRLARYHTGVLVSWDEVIPAGRVHHGQRLNEVYECVVNLNKVYSSLQEERDTLLRRVADVRATARAEELLQLSSRTINGQIAAYRRAISETENATRSSMVDEVTQAARTRLSEIWEREAANCEEFWSSAEPY